MRVLIALLALKARAVGVDILQLARNGAGFARAHIRYRRVDSHNADGTGFEREQGYKYPHSFPNHWVRQQYLPDAIKNARYYEYGDNKIEQAARAYWEAIKK